MTKQILIILPRWVAFQFLVVAWLCASAPLLFGQATKPPAAADWERIVEAGRKEGKVTVSIPASAEMRKQLEENFKKSFGIEVEVFTSRGSAGGAAHGR